MMIANSITLFRLVLFGVFLGTSIKSGPLTAWPWFLLSWALDAIDGTIARRFHEESQLGSLLDKIVDRIILTGTGVYFLSYHVVSPFIILLFLKDILLIPALLWHWRSHTPIQSAGILGKITTALQGAGLLWFLFHWPGLPIVVIVTAAVGTACAVLYWNTLWKMSSSSLPANT